MFSEMPCAGSLFCMGCVSVASCSSSGAVVNFVKVGFPYLTWSKRVLIFNSQNSTEENMKPNFKAFGSM